MLSYRNTHFLYDLPSRSKVTGILDIMFDLPALNDRGLLLGIGKQSLNIATLRRAGHNQV